MSKGWAGGSTRAWRRTRALVLQRDGHLCQLKLSVCTTLATCVHHVRGKAAGDDPSNLLASCTPCNIRIGEPAKHNPQSRGVTTW